MYRIALCHWLLLISEWVCMASSRRTLSILYFSDCFMEEAYEEGFDVIFNYGSSRRRQGEGMCWGALICILKNIFKPHVPPYILLGGSKTLIESSALRRAPLMDPFFIFFRIFFFFYRFLLFLSPLSWSWLGYVTVEV